MMRQTPFGQELKDLDIRFDFSDRPRLVTALLAAAHEGMDEQTLWSWPVGRRLLSLLQWTAASSDHGLTVNRACQSCGAMMELHYEAGELISLIEAHQEDTVAISYQGQELVMMRPSGRHQQAWQKAVFSTAREAGVAMLQSLSKSPLPKALVADDKVLAAVEERLAAADPLIDYQVTTACPACGQVQSWAIDWEEFCLRHLHQQQQLMLRSVARLAGHYHWSEQEIMVMPEWRRRHYAALI